MEDTAVSIGVSNYQRREEGHSIDGEVSFRDLAVVCLFSALGLTLTAVAIMLGGFDEVAEVLAQIAY
jgi:hypothetical protein